MLEKEVEGAVVRYAEKRGLLSLKLNGIHDRGKPDRLFFYRNRCLVVEFKAPKKKPTKLQWEWIAKFKALGFRATYRDNIGRGKDLIDEFIETTDAEMNFLEEYGDMI